MPNAFHSFSSIGIVALPRMSMCPCACSRTRFVRKHDCLLPIRLTLIVRFQLSRVSVGRTALLLIRSEIHFRL